MSDISKHLRCTDCGIGRPIGGSLHTAAECRDNLRNALDEAEAERDEARADISRIASEVVRLRSERDIDWQTRAYKAEAEVARLRGEYERGLREAAGVLRDAAKKHRHDADASRSVAASGGHVLAADILESYANVIDLLDAAPAAKGGE